MERVVTIMQNPRQYKIPDWFLNRQKDVKDGKYSQVSVWLRCLFLMLLVSFVPLTHRKLLCQLFAAALDLLMFRHVERLEFVVTVGWTHCRSSPTAWTTN